MKRGKLKDPIFNSDGTMEGSKKTAKKEGKMPQNELVNGMRESIMKIWT